jgi:type II secretory ATPase GspE/PulE/Tfp pilus assembly ATPase PilB-like protein
MAQLGREIGPVFTPTMYRGRGCSECKHTGYRGRTAILELLVMDESLRNFVTQRASAAEIRLHMMPLMQTMRQAGWLKVARGITTPEEVLRATHLGDIADDQRQ